ncbi:MAG: LuxR C-terminal-related transcriptional regulator, partial [Dehalococcoidia bacterium]|nr:LuxR C-terminal-related transcriptional regulator [Dehalococcoidia bacterium]
DEVYIPRLRMDAVRDMVQGLLAGKASNELIETVYARTGGYPLYIESLVAGLIDAGYFLRPHAEKDIWAIEAARTGPLPPLLRDLILGRLEQLSATDRIVLDMIAISGDIATYSYLRTESGQSDKALFRSLRSLKAHYLVAERIDGAEVGYSIVHPLIREVAIDDLPEIERRRHVAASEEHNLLLERRTGQPSFSRHEAKDPLFDHSPGATARVEPDPTPLPDLSGVLSDSQTPRGDAGWPASASLAVGIEGEREATSGGDNESLPWLLEQLGEAWGQFGDWRSAIDVWNEALALLTDGRKQAALSEKETMAVTRLHRRLALAEWDRGHFDVANAHLKASLIYSGEKSDPQSADLTFTRHRVFNQLGDAMGTLGSAAALIGMARRLSSPRAEAEANLVTTVFALAQGDIEGARKHALSALRLGESFPEGEALAMRLRGHAMLTLVGMRLGDHHFMRYHAERGLAVAQRPGAPPMEVVPRVRLAHAYFMAGLWDEAVRLGMEAVGAGRRIGNPHYLAYALAWRAMILALNGELPEAEACIAEVRIVHGSEVPEDRQVFSLVDIAEAALALERGQVERALGITRGFARPPRSWEATPAGVTSASKPMALMLLAEAQVAAGDPESALKTAHDLAFLGPPGAPYLTALSSRAEGLARLAQGQREGAISCFARAYETFTSLGMPFEAARALLEQASATTLTQPAVAAAAAHLSLATFEHIGAQRYADRARRLLRGLGISIPLRRRTSLSRGPLTIRQLQIARLVAEGLANSGIAERLVLSQRTVTTHLDHIYACLGIGSRTALSRYITETRLLSLEDDKA